MNKLFLLINNSLGLEVTKYVANQNDLEIKAIILNEPNKRTDDYKDKVRGILKEYHKDCIIFETDEKTWESEELITQLQEASHGISVLYGHVIPSKWLTTNQFKIMNLHPSFLPIGRGADPIPWGIIENRPHGVTLHEIDGGLDTGPIIKQARLNVDLSASSGEIYTQAMHLLFEIFQDTLGPWLNNEIKSIKQMGDYTSHKSNDLKSLKESISHGNSKYEELIRVINGLTFNDGRLPRLKLSDGNLWELKLEMRKVEE